MTTELPGGTLRLLDSPIRFMQRRVDGRPPRLYRAFTPVVVNALLVGGASAIVASRTSVLGAALPEAMTAQAMSIAATMVLAVIAGLTGFVVRAAIVVGLGTLVSPSGKGWRIVELTALAYWTQVLWAAPGFAAMWLFYDPPPMVLRAGAQTDVLMAVVNHAEEMAKEPLQIVMTQTEQMFGAWLIALNAVALRVVGGLTTWGTVAVAVVLAAVFLGAPLAAEHMAGRLFG